MTAVSTRRYVTVLCTLTFTSYCFAASVGQEAPTVAAVVPAISKVPKTDVDDESDTIVYDLEVTTTPTDISSSELDSSEFFTHGDATGKNCTYLEFRCKNGHQCIPDALACDGYPHCKDQSDEEKAMCLKHPCDDDEWIMCKSSGRCIRRTMVCDDIQDCADGSDEDVYMCNKYDEMPDEKFFGDDSIPGMKDIYDDLLEYPTDEVEPEGGL